MYREYRHTHAAITQLDICPVYINSAWVWNRMTCCCDTSMYDFKQEKEETKRDSNVVYRQQMYSFETILMSYCFELQVFSLTWPNWCSDRSCKHAHRGGCCLKAFYYTTLRFYWAQIACFQSKIQVSLKYIRNENVVVYRFIFYSACNVLCTSLQHLNGAKVILDDQAEKKQLLHPLP